LSFHTDAHSNTEPEKFVTTELYTSTPYPLFLVTVAATSRFLAAFSLPWPLLTPFPYSPPTPRRWIYSKSAAFFEYATTPLSIIVPSAPSYSSSHSTGSWFENNPPEFEAIVVRCYRSPFLPLQRSHRRVTSPSNALRFRFSSFPITPGEIQWIPPPRPYVNFRRAISPLSCCFFLYAFFSPRFFGAFSFSCFLSSSTVLCLASGKTDPTSAF